MKGNLSVAVLFGKNSMIIAAFFMALILYTPPVIAREGPLNRLQSSQAKALTIDALVAINKNNWKDARDKIAQSRDPLASKLYHWLLLTKADKKLDSHFFIRLSHFVRQNPEWPSMSKIKVRAEGVMPEDLPNMEVLAWYKEFRPVTPYGMMRYMDALIIEGEKDNAREFLADWWASTLTSRDQQRRIFKKYGQYLTLEAHKRRFNSLLYNKHYGSAIGIAGVLGQGYPALAKARAALAKNHSIGLAELIDAVPQHLQNDPGLLYERMRWRKSRGLNSGVLEILDNAPISGNIQNRKEWWGARHIMIRRFMEKGDNKRAYLLASKHVQKDGFEYAQAEWLAGWLALRFMKKPTEAYERFFVLYGKVSTPVSKSRAAYWAGRAAHDLGDEELAQSWYKKASIFKTAFYGQLAASALVKESGLPKVKLPRLSAADIANFEKNELFQASEIFKLSKMNGMSKEFLKAFLVNDGTPKAYRFVAEKFAQRGDYNSAVRVAKQATRKGLFLTKQSYPTITNLLENVHMAEWALIHAIIRQESMFDQRAKSHAGARGLMQLMPATARGVAKEINVSYRKSSLTSKPKYNILLGATYLSQLITRYGGSYPLAIAAYNAGPSRVDLWLRVFGDPRLGDVDMLDWIEMIPIYETRNYVQRVTEGLHIYRVRLLGIQKQPKNNLHVALHTNP